MSTMTKIRHKPEQLTIFKFRPLADPRRKTCDNERKVRTCESTKPESAPQHTRCRTVKLSLGLKFGVCGLVFGYCRGRDSPELCLAKYWRFHSRTQQAVQHSSSCQTRMLQRADLSHSCDAYQEFYIPLYPPGINTSGSNLTLLRNCVQKGAWSSVGPLRVRSSTHTFSTSVRPPRVKNHVEGYSGLSVPTDGSEPFFKVLLPTLPRFRMSIK